MKPKDATGSPRQPSLIVERGLRRPKAEIVQAMMEPSIALATKYTRQSIRWATGSSLLVTPANEQDRAQVGKLAQVVQEVTGQSVELAFVDQGYSGDVPAEVARQHGIQLEVIKLPQAKRGFVLLPRSFVVERSFAWTARFRRLVRDYERLPATLAGLHLIVFACHMLHQWISI